MELVAGINRVKYDYFRWRFELSIPWKLVLALAVAGSIGLLAQVRFPIPWSPVPITGQTFGVLLAGVLLGRWWGGISMAMYGGLGIAGLPLFAGWSSGLGATGGYIIGFVLAALFLGYFTDKYIRARSFTSMLGLMLVANFVIIYIPGLVWLGLWLNATVGVEGIGAVLAIGATPFIVGDITKAVLAALAARGMTPKKAYNDEADQGKWASRRLP
jgi:biotin transport system substrate-specific component